jgi:ribosomal protein S18 acetylase RimI-like enzyme
MTSLTITHASTEAELAACFEVIRQLRPRLASPEAWCSQATAMRSDGYRVIAARREERVVALAGYRLQTNLVHGHFLFVNDLVTLVECRGQGLGSALLRALDGIAHTAGCDRLVLDTALANHGARNFYRREGLQEVIAGFIKPLGQAA